MQGLIRKEGVCLSMPDIKGFLTCWLTASECSKVNLGKFLRAYTFSADLNVYRENVLLACKTRWNITCRGERENC